MSDQPDTRYSRRTVLKGVAAASGLAVVPTWAAVGTTAIAEATEEAPRVEGPVLAYIKDAAKGEVVFMIGTSEVVRRDKRLVTQLLKALSA